MNEYKTATIAKGPVSAGIKAHLKRTRVTGIYTGKVEYILTLSITSFQKSYDAKKVGEALWHILEKQKFIQTVPQNKGAWNEDE